MDKRIIIAKKDGSVTVRVPAQQARRMVADPVPVGEKPKPRWETDDEFLTRCMADPVHHGECESMTVMDKADVPRKDEYRNAWTFKAGKFGHDMVKARNLHRDLIREARKELFAQNDIAATWASINGDKAAMDAAKAEQKRLRDAPADPRIEAATTIAQLRAVTL